MPRIIVVAILIVIVAAGALVWRATRSGPTDTPATATTIPGTGTSAADPASTTGVTTEPPDTPGAAGYTPVVEDTDCAFDLVTDRQHRCGFLVVPEDRANPDGGGEVRIHFAVFESSNPDAPDDPILYLDGGPGGETLETLQFTLEPTWSGFIANRDLILFDQRGVGYTTPSLACQETRDLTFELLDDDLPTEEYLARERDALAECRDRVGADGVDFTQYHSAANAADVADLRIALDIDEWNLLGISYGTRLAQTVMRDHPEGLRSVILDSNYSPEDDLITQAPANLARALDVLWAGCDAHPGCADAFPDLEDRFWAVVADLDAAPLTFAVRDVFSGTRHDALLDGQALIGSMFQGLYSAEVIPVLPQVIAELEEGVTTTIALLMTNDLANGEFFSYGMHLSVQCHEEVPFADEQAVAEAAAAEARLTEFFNGASNIGPPVFALCELWQAGEAPALENEPVTSSVPTLVLAGEYDPITPPEWGRRAAEQLDAVGFVEFPGVGHAASVSGDCPLEVALAFYDDPTAPPDTGCMAAMHPPAFAVPDAAAPPPVEMEPFQQNVFGLTVSGVAPDGWESVGPGAWARQTTAIDQTALIQQAAPGANEPDLLIALLAPQLGFEDEPEPARTVDAGGRSWTLYEGVVDGFPADVALGPGEGTTGVVILISSADERDTLVESVLMPALEAFRAT